MSKIKQENEIILWYKSEISSIVTLTQNIFYLIYVYLIISSSSFFGFDI